MPRQQISWRTFSPSSWTTRRLRPLTSRFELLYKIFINIRIITCIEERVFVILLFLRELYVQRFVYVSDVVFIYTHFKSSLYAISIGYTRT